MLPFVHNLQSRQIRTGHLSQREHLTQRTAGNYHTLFWSTENIFWNFTKTLDLEQPFKKEEKKKATSFYFATAAL